MKFRRTGHPKSTLVTKAERFKHKITHKKVYSHKRFCSFEYTSFGYQAGLLSVDSTYKLQKNLSRCCGFLKLLTSSVFVHSLTIEFYGYGEKAVPIIFDLAQKSSAEENFHFVLGSAQYTTKTAFTFDFATYLTDIGQKNHFNPKHPQFEFNDLRISFRYRPLNLLCWRYRLTLRYRAEDIIIIRPRFGAAAVFPDDPHSPFYRRQRRRRYSPGPLNQTKLTVDTDGTIHPLQKPPETLLVRRPGSPAPES